MSTVTYRHENNYSYKKGGVKHVVKEEIIDGEKGLSFHYLSKAGDDKFHSITVRQFPGEDKYSVRQKMGDKTDDSEMNMAELEKMIKKMKELKFVEDFLPKRGTFKGRKGSKKGSRKASKKGSRKSIKGGAKKSSKKSSKKGSKKSSKKGSRKSMKGGAKKGSKKGSKKASKKSSKKSSRKVRKATYKGIPGKPFELPSPAIEVMPEPEVMQMLGGGVDEEMVGKF